MSTTPKPNTKVTRGWPPERRARQAELIRARKPWLKSTGPRTAAGKAKTRYNGLKHGRRCKAYRDLRSAMYALYQDCRRRIADLDTLQFNTPSCPKRRVSGKTKREINTNRKVDKVAQSSLMSSRA